MILILGDSNFRNMIEVHGEELSTNVGEEIKFHMATSNETTRIHLENRTDSPKIVIIGSPINEIVQKYNENKKKGRAETIRDVLEEQQKIVKAAAEANGQVLFLLVPPFLRLDPVWFKERVSLAVFHVKDFVGEDGPWNLAVANPVKFKEEDVSEDKVHLNAAGKEKLFKAIESDIKICKSNLGEDQQPTLDWASQMCTQETPTPSTIRKRVREETESEDETGTTGKKAKIDTVLDRIDLLMRKMDEERGSSKAEITNLSTKVEVGAKAVEEIKETVDKLQKTSKNDVTFSAELREDLDSLENENLKNTVIVRKLKGENVPKDKKALRTYIQEKARALVKEILDEEAAKNVKYAATLFSFIDPSKKDNAAGLVPPFKVGFGSKEIGVRFRDAAVKKAKEEGSVYKDTYFSYYQCLGTKVRSILLWGAVEAAKDPEKEPGREVWVTQNSPKPTLQIKEGGKIVKTLSFVKAMQEYKDKIPQKSIDEANKIARKHFRWKAGEDLHRLERLVQNKTIRKDHVQTS
jgi:archaellum component FlaC